MATSGTYDFQFTMPALIEQAQERAGLDIESVTARDQRFIIRELNTLFSDWANNGPRLWAIDLQVVPIVSGQTTFTSPSSTVDLLEVVLRRDNYDYILTRFSRQNYMELPNKTQSGRPTNFWVDKLTPQYITHMWPVTDQSNDEIRYYRMVQLQDANGRGTENPNVPYLWSEAICSALAFRIASREAMKANATMTLDKVGFLKQQADQTYFNAVKQNSEKVPMRLEPQAGSYWRI